MTSKNISELIIIVGLIILGIIISASLFGNTEENYITTPTPSPTVDTAKKYKDLMTSKCYNQEEIEVSCKA